VVQGRLGQWIGGNEVFGGAETFEVIAPATEERLCVAEVASREAGMRKTKRKNKKK
jgi:hypothetical protein